MLKLNDDVIMSVTGKRKYPLSDSNPHSTNGLISEIHGHMFVVKWDTGRFNYYVAEDLELINVIVENE